MTESFKASEHRKELGEWGENLVADYYRDKGVDLLARNVRFRHGELDLIVQEPDGTVVFVEVKTRSGRDYGAAESVTRAKFRRMRSAASTWLREWGGGFVPVRFDVVTVTLNGAREPEIEVFEGVEHGAR